MKKKKASAVYLSGKIIERGIYVFSSRLDALPDGEYFHAEISAYNKGSFTFQERDEQVESICIRRESREEPFRALCVVPRFNSIVGFYQKDGQEYSESLPEPRNKSGGVMKQLRLIDGGLYAVGSGGCVYKRLSKNNWILFDEGFDTRDTSYYRKQGYSFSQALDLSSENETNINSINGLGERLFCAGDRGEVFFRKNATWIKVDSGTNSILTDVQLDGGRDQSVYVCGWRGTLLKGDERGFSQLLTNVDDYLKSMAFFNGELYVGGSKGLYKLVGKSLQLVKTNQNAPFNCVELDAYDGELLVVSDRWFLVFDGVNWRRIDDPDNADVLQRQ